MTRPFLDAGDGVEVRRLDPDDADVLQPVIEANRGRLREWMWWTDGSTVETSRAFIEAAVDGDKLDPLGIVVDGRLVGVIGAHADPITGNRDIGYWIAASHEGRGIVTRACSALISHLFGVEGCHRIAIRAGLRNGRSRAIPSRLGSTEEGVLREAGRNSNGYHDMVVYGLLENEWRNR